MLSFIIQAPPEAFILLPTTKIKDLSNSLRLKPFGTQGLAYGAINHKGLQLILRFLRPKSMSRQDLRMTLQSKTYPQVSLRQSILLLYAEPKLFRNASWITVCLYYIPQRAYVKYCQTSIPKCPPPEFESDGEILWNILFHYQQNQASTARVWKEKLTPSKQKVLEMLLHQTPSKQLRYKGILEALYNVLRFPGMRSGLELGNMHKYLAMHCPEQIEHYLRYIHNIWNTIIGDDLGRATLVQDKVVQMLHMKVPSNLEDRRLINIIFDTNQMHLEDDHIRDTLKANTLCLNGMIPSLVTFHDDMRYFAIGMQIIRRYITHDTVDESVIESLSRTWKSNPIIEVSEHEFDAIESSSVQLAFQQLLLFALRHFPLLSDEKPLHDTPGENLRSGVCSLYLNRLIYLAYNLGFHTPKVLTYIRQTRQDPLYRMPTPRRDRQPTPWRGGKPTLQTFYSLRIASFLPNLQNPDAAHKITSTVVMSNFMYAFLDRPRLPVSLQQMISWLSIRDELAHMRVGMMEDER